MRRTASPKFALEGIAQDAVFYSRVLRAIMSQKDCALLIPSFVPLVSLFVVESHDRLKEILPEFTVSPWEMLEVLRPRRHRTKLLLSDRQSIEEVVAEYDSIVADERAHFLALHSGFLGPLRRVLQPDLGLSRIDGCFFSTTHATRFFLGPEARDGEYHRRLGYFCSGYLEAFLKTFGPGRSLGTFPSAAISEVEMVDIKSRRLYGRGDLGLLEQRWAAPITMLLANMNFIGRVVGPFAPREYPTLLKLRTLTAYNTLHSLNQIQQRLRAAGQLPEPAGEVLASALSQKDCRWLRKKSALRNLFTHYRPATVTAAELRLTQEEAVAHYGRCELGELHERVSSVHEHLSEILSRGFALRPRSFEITGAVT